MGLAQGYGALLLGVVGLLVGSFLNVVIYRLPKIMERQWAMDCQEQAGRVVEPTGTYNLAVPRSSCPHCGHTIAWYENVPVLSYLFLRGRCSSCVAPIGVRYPVVELVTGALFAYCGYRWGVSIPSFLWAGYCAALVTLTMIDWDTTLLPDDITLPLLWAGLIASSLQWTAVPLTSSLAGAVAGYLSLWTVYWGFKLVMGKEGMGYGDFKLFAALGAWFGWQALIPIILLASVVGSVVGLVMKFSHGLREGGAIPFGPFLAGAGLGAMFIGPSAMLGLLGL